MGEFDLEEMMLYRLRHAFLLSTVMAAFFIPASGFAADLGYCGQDADCDCSVQSGYDSCAEIDMGNLPNTDDPYALREAWNMETSYDSNTGEFKVNGEITTPESRIIPTPSNGGNWESMEVLNNYINALTGADGLPEQMDICKPDKYWVMEFEGFYGRWDAGNGQWAGVQGQGPIWDAITGPNGNLTVDGVNIDNSGIENQCTQPSSGDLAMRQCSEARGKSDGQGLEAMCGHDYHDTIPGQNARAINRIKDVWWKNTNSGLYNGMWRSKDADYVELDAHWYNGSGYHSSTNASAVQNVSSHHLGKSGLNGTCGYGFVQRNTVQIGGNGKVKTRAGTAPSICPTAP